MRIQLRRKKILEYLSIQEKLKNLSDILLNVPSKIVYKIQEYHLPIYHLICLCVENESFDV